MVTHSHTKTKQTSNDWNLKLTKTYYAFSSGEKTPKLKYVQKKADSVTSPKQKRVQATKDEGYDIIMVNNVNEWDDDDCYWMMINKEVDDTYDEDRETDSDRTESEQNQDHILDHLPQNTI
ncbi:hypothetical protein Tco_0454509 [Tanacetum coccineum]